MSKKHRSTSQPAARTVRTDWGEVADWYDQLVGESGSEYHREVVLPGALRLLAVQPGQQFLDIACGQGVLCRIVHERGAVATGVDAARDLIAIARQRNDNLPDTGPKPTFHAGDARELEFSLRPISTRPRAFLRSRTSIPSSRCLPALRGRSSRWAGS
jgi:ubiquinone/menaquinone biosynthesis C-methylase UbiE